MIVDDDKIQRELMAKLLEDKDLQILSAENGQQALSYLEHVEPALILLDLNMPIMDGLELLEHLQKHDRWCSIPVIILTSMNLSTEEQADLNQRVASIFYKADIQQQDFLRQIHQLVKNVTTYKQYQIKTDFGLETITYELMKN